MKQNQNGAVVFWYLILLESTSLFPVNFKAETHPLTKDTQDRTSKEPPICVVLFVVCVSQFNLNLLNFQEETF